METLQLYERGISFRQSPFQDSPQQLKLPDDKLNSNTQSPNVSGRQGFLIPCEVIVQVTDPIGFNAS